MFSSVSRVSSSIVPRIVSPSRCGVCPETNRNRAFGDDPGAVRTAGLRAGDCALHGCSSLANGYVRAGYRSRGSDPGVGIREPP